MNATLKRRVDVTVPLSAGDLAELWCELDAHGQADFFSHLADMTDRWGPGKAPIQMQRIADSHFLTLNGRRFMQSLSEYSHAPSIY